jgi:guanylate kinase
MKTNKHFIFTFIGRTASGKSLIIKNITRDLGLSQVKSYTTRKPRPTELEESDHIFIEETDIEKYKDDIFAYTEIGKNKYFCTLEQIMNNDLYTIDPLGLMSLREKHIKNLMVVPIYIYASIDVRVGRFLGRGNTIDEFCERDIKEDEQFRAFEILSQSVAKPSYK